MSTIPHIPVSIVPVPDVPVLASIGDPDGTRTVTSIVVLLVAIGLALLLLAVWIYRTTRPDPDLLAPLEAMGERSWRRGDPVWQRRRLDELRPPGAKPLAPSVAPPELDASFDAGPTAPGFDDLRTDPTRGSGEVPADAPAPDPPGPAATDEGAGSVRDEMHADGTTVDSGDDESEAVEQTEPGEPVGDEPQSDEPDVEQSPADSTPSGAIGPALDVFLDDDFDPDALAAAREQLERELAEAGREVSHQRQLGLFDRDSDT